MTYSLRLDQRQVKVQRSLLPRQIDLFILKKTSLISDPRNRSRGRKKQAMGVS
jgi:hypothetical protein